MTHDRAWEPVIGLEIHVQLKTRDEDVLPLPRTRSARRRTRRPARSASRFPGALPVPNRRAIEDDDQARARPRLRDRRARRLPPQELLLSRPAEGVPDQPVRRAALRGRASSPCRATDGDVDDRHHARAPRGGRGEEHPRRGVRAASTAATATLVDFNRGGTPLVEIVTEPDLHDRRDGEALPAAAAADGGRARALRRRAREGLDALRRQRLGRARRARTSCARAPS